MWWKWCSRGVALVWVKKALRSWASLIMMHTYLWVNTDSNDLNQNWGPVYDIKMIQKPTCEINASFASFDTGDQGENCCRHHVMKLIYGYRALIHLLLHSMNSNLSLPACLLALVLTNSCVQRNLAERWLSFHALCPSLASPVSHCFPLFLIHPITLAFPLRLVSFNDGAVPHCPSWSSCRHLLSLWLHLPPFTRGLGTHRARHPSPKHSKWSAPASVSPSMEFLTLVAMSSVVELLLCSLLHLFTIRTRVWNHAVFGQCY